jgi:hypothetical protein
MIGVDTSVYPTGATLYGDVVLTAHDWRRYLIAVDDSRPRTCGLYFSGRLTDRDVEVRAQVLKYAPQERCASDGVEKGGTTS